MPELEKYLKSLPSAQVSPAPFGTEELEEDFVHQIEDEVAKAVV
jgi:hypothetical protein